MLSTSTLTCMMCMQKLNSEYGPHFKNNLWVTRLLNKPNTFIEFHFIKNGNQDSMKKRPIHDLKVWTHDLNMIVIMLKDPWKK
jgi:hypothetical protein